MTGSPIYFAFADRAIDYDCAPCGACCRGLGIAERTGDLKAAVWRETAAPYLDPRNSDERMHSFFTFADGCRYLANDNLCDVHREHGATAKPLICRLFPFSKLVGLDGLSVLLPQGSCPWGPSGAAGGSELSSHQALAALLDTGGQGEPSHLSPTPVVSLSPLPVPERLAFEQELRDRIWEVSGAGGWAGADAAIREIYRARGYELADAPGDPDLWLDLLRCAGQPPGLGEENARLLAAAAPALRILWLPDIPDWGLPNALAGFELYLRSLAELGSRCWTGQDLFRLAEHFAPLARVLAVAELPIPELAADGPDATDEIWSRLRESTGQPLGAVLLKQLRPVETGALGILRQVGRALPLA